MEENRKDKHRSIHGERSPGTNRVGFISLGKKASSATEAQSHGRKTGHEFSRITRKEAGGPEELLHYAH